MGLYNLKLQFVMDTQDAAMLRAIVDKLRVSKGHVLRSLIRDRYTMEIQGIPTCATGKACSCPQLVITPPAPLPLPIPDAPGTRAA